MVSFRLFQFDIYIYLMCKKYGSGDITFTGKNIYILSLFIAKNIRYTK